MTVLFVLLTFGFFLALDAWSHRNEMVPAAATSLPETEAFRFEPVWVAGFQVPDGLHYHRGHTWVRTIGPDMAVVGIDDFARRLIGPISRAALPKAGSWLRQGDRGGRASASTAATPTWWRRSRARWSRPRLPARERPRPR